ncbi:eukaryotic translation initiation factor eIF-3 subunit H [Klebsormidium nitens]|uniref:Eukaryotic translation initiation factor 3 subunit H n=1 Tax=Klebsormidium nitens TaxID=105231 RepID=A0A1Y1I1K2_KLENI|nr:eukaryotic translation initiation factor eIF-3 subunit H [Klebsormidium nitens]|eukprot:GAQ84794.1 eukaryotic translation initiation factor eIF-3 subunit H [Klebsormidium nitens]
MAESSAAPARTWAQAAQTKEEEVPLRTVQIDGLALLKIIKHCKEFAPNLVTGQLLGLDIGSVLEVTNCFPFPTRSEEEEDGEDSATYQLEMMRSLREVNVDNNTVGWYQSTYMGAYQSVELIDTFLQYQENIKRCVCIIYDPQRSSQGVLALKALKLKEPFMEAYKNDALTGEGLRQSGISWPDIFEEIKVSVHNSALVGAMVTDIQPEAPVTHADFDRLSLSSAPFLEKNLEFLIQCMDDLGQEQQKQQYYYRAVTRQEAQKGAWLLKRRAENAARKAAGEEPLPEEDSANPAFKPIPEPSRLDGFLITNQISNYCGQVNGFGGQSLSKMYVMDAVHEEH